MTASMINRTAIVTGGSRGICLAAAKAMLDRGSNVCLTGRHEDQLAEALDHLAAPGRAISVCGHAAEPEHQEATVARTMETFGSVDVLVNGVGINPFYGSTSDLPQDVALKMYRTNVLAPLAWFTVCEKVWMGEHGGSVVNLSSAGAFRGGPLLGSYGVTKAALVRLTEQLALEKAPLGIRVNAVAPGTVRTRFAAQFWEGNEEAAAAAYPLGRAGEPEDVAEAIAFFASDDSSWITGQTLVIDGGLLLTTLVDSLA
ncbi:MAG: short-chain dehydrogenase/reductase [Marmoricola sp.]|jgi:NAD(P)-dependent dehydrogenase (short-subunit alcohol dehydrogenase family)|nr:short-chain dehydrogenase/reductase [Marmoricola sp.]